MIQEKVFHRDKCQRGDEVELNIFTVKEWLYCSTEASYIK
jgi:hypothetical protein